jgi:hypothetical protein
MPHGDGLASSTGRADLHLHFGHHQNAERFAHDDAVMREVAL